MFEQEIEMEKRESSVVPLLLMVALILTIVGLAGYYLIQNRKVLAMDEATKIVNSALSAQGDVTLEFRTGMVKSSVAEKPHDPHYRLLEKEGLIKLGKDTGPYGTTVPVALTDKGRSFLKQISGVSQTRDKDGTDVYIVPVAQRKLTTVSAIKMISPTRATIDYTWNWQTNALGELLDAAGPTVKSFNTWDRATLIQKYGANFYHGGPTSVAIAVNKTDTGWQIATE